MSVLRHKTDGSVRWLIHYYGLAKYYFDIRIVQSKDGVTLDQRPYSHDVLESVLGAGWESQSTPADKTKYAMALPAGTAYEARLAAAIPLTPIETTAAETQFGWKFRTILSKFMQLANWTHNPDLVTGVTCVAQYQSSPGIEHFEALHRMLLYLRVHPDRSLTYRRYRHTAPLAASPSSADSTPAAVHSSLILVGHHAHGTSLGDPIEMSHEATHPTDGYSYPSMTMQVPRVSAIKTAADSTTPAPTAASSPPITVLGPPPTEGMMDANHGSILRQ